MTLPMGSAPLDPAPPVPQVTTLACPHCGAPLALKAQGWAESVACGSCGSILDATQGALRLVQEHDRAVTLTPAIPLGTRGTWRGTHWDIIGCQQVTITVEGSDYSWREYVGFNPYRGFLYLSEYDGHWNVIEKLRRRPVLHEGAHPTATLDDRTFRHFQTAMARTTAALGEFPWALRVGDAVTVADYVDPPFILSGEGGDTELTWSLGRYATPQEIAAAFQLTRALRTPVGVFANQPNPHVERGRAVLRTLALALAALLAVVVGTRALAANTVVFQQQYTVAGATSAEGGAPTSDPATDPGTFVTPPFTLGGRTSNVELRLDTDLDNAWLWFTLTLVNEATGAARDLGRQVSYYHGRDGDGSWSEGSRDDRVRIGEVPPGRYFLRVAVEGDDTPGAAAPVAHAVRLTVRRDVPDYTLMLLALAALVVPALLVQLPRSTFEGARWVQSDHAPASHDSSDDDE